MSDPEPLPRSTATGAEIVLRNPNRYPETRARAMRPWLERLVAGLAPGGAGLGVKFVSDREMRRLNNLYRGLDRTTDVLSFPGSATPEGPYLGDVVVSVPSARRQARERGHSAERELRTLLLHGLLHCLGHDHETDGGVMSGLERRLRERWIASDD